MESGQFAGATTVGSRRCREIESYRSLSASCKNDLKNSNGRDLDLLQKRISQLQAQLDDITDEQAQKFGYTAKTLPGGYNRSALEELVRWRLWERTGGGLMAELGSHQLDASGIFISAMGPEGGKALPLTVQAVGGRSLFPMDRECEDHVYCMYEFPRLDTSKKEARRKLTIRIARWLFRIRRSMGMDLAITARWCWERRER